MTGFFAWRGRKIGRWILLAGVVASVAWAGFHQWRERKRATRTSPAATRTSMAGTHDHDQTSVPRVVPAGTRIRIEVLNATDTHGLARQAMFVLRDAGFDVVSFGNAKERSDSSVVRVHSGHEDWAALAVKAVRGGTRIESRPDSSRYLDLTVLIGRNWSPPSEPLYP